MNEDDRNELVPSPNSPVSVSEVLLGVVEGAGIEDEDEEDNDDDDDDDEFEEEEDDDEADKGDANDEDADALACEDVVMGGNVAEDEVGELSNEYSPNDVHHSESSLLSCSF